MYKSKGSKDDKNNYRNLVMLSVSAKIVARVAASRLSKWMETWMPEEQNGFRPGRGIDDVQQFFRRLLEEDSLVFDTCAYLAGAAQEGQVVRGISYDFEKCFDRVPVGLAVNILRTRGCDNRVCKALDGFYSSRVKHFRLERHYDEPLRPANGLVQGCPLSMLVLSSMVSCWHEHLQASLPGVVPKSYADDISACTKSTRPRQVRAQVVAVHTHTHTHTHASLLPGLV